MCVQFSYSSFTTYNPIVVFMDCVLKDKKTSVFHSQAQPGRRPEKGQHPVFSGVYQASHVTDVAGIREENSSYLQCAVCDVFGNSLGVLIFSLTSG